MTYVGGIFLVGQLRKARDSGRIWESTKKRQFLSISICIELHILNYYNRLILPPF